MRAVTFDQFGGPEVLHESDLPSPRAATSEVLVRVVASTVNPTDLLMRSGQQAQMMEDLFPPFIPGMEFSGRVIGGDAFQAGERVIGVLNPRKPQGGSFADVIAVPAASVAPVARNVDLLAAATVPMNALTAMMALDMLRLNAGDTVLVTGGAGMLGGYAIQLARLAGLRVLANTSPKDAALVAGFGAQHLLPRDEGMEEALRAVCPAGVDGLIDGALIGESVAAYVRDGGSAVSLRSSHPIADPRLQVAYVSVLKGMMDSDRLRRIAELIGTGHLTPRVAENGIFSPSQAVEAHRMAETGGFRGRVVVQFGE